MSVTTPQTRSTWMLTKQPLKDAMLVKTHVDGGSIAHCKTFIFIKMALHNSKAAIFFPAAHNKTFIFTPQSVFHRTKLEYSSKFQHHLRTLCQFKKYAAFPMFIDEKKYIRIYSSRKLWNHLYHYIKFFGKADFIIVSTSIYTTKLNPTVLKREFLENTPNSNEPIATKNCTWHGSTKA